MTWDFVLPIIVIMLGACIVFKVRQKRPRYAEIILKERIDAGAWRQVHYQKVNEQDLMIRLKSLGVTVWQEQMRREGESQLRVHKLKRSDFNGKRFSFCYYTEQAVPGSFNIKRKYVLVRLV